MASLSTNKKNGRRKVQFTFEGKRRTVSLGKCTKRQGEAVTRHIEQLVASRSTGHTVPDTTGTWLGEIDARLTEALARCGLIESRRSKHPETLAAFINEYVASRTDVKPATKEIWKQGARGLIDRFGARCKLRDVTPGDADAYKMELGRTLKPYTVQKRLTFAGLVFKAAFRLKVIPENPFAGVTVKLTMEDRKHFVTRQDVDKLLAACPSTDWRLIVALSRFGGLRAPSEVLSVRWSDVIWDAGRDADGNTIGKLHVTSPKTEHHVGMDSRVIPLFAPLRAELEAAFEARFLDSGYDSERDGPTFVVDVRYRMSAVGPAGWRNCNLRTTLLKIVKRAGLKPWKKLLHNMRSSCETELLDDHPIHAVAGWMGHSVAVATKHYTQITDEHFARACSATQNPTQSVSASVSTDVQHDSADAKNPRKKQAYAASCGAVLINKVEDDGFEPTTYALPARRSPN